MKPNNVTRLLDAKKIPYAAFELSAEKHSALDTARMLHVPPEMVFKTIVIVREGKGKPVLAIIPAPFAVDLKMLAKVLGEKKLLLPTEKEAERLTGLQAGGISPLALLNRGFQMVLDETARCFEEIHLSGGQRGLNIRLRVDDLVALIAPAVAEISRAA
ncbi:MAG: aminoacyl-tRNA deacylase [Chloroflexota bacterium]